MSEPTLNVPGIDPARIECCTGKDGRQVVNAMGYPVASLTLNGEVAFYANYSDSIRENCKKVMNAAIDHWRATGRLFPEPSPEPVECVCGILAKAGTTPDDRTFVICKSPACYLRANTVEQWNTMQAALKAAKEGK